MCGRFTLFSDGAELARLFGCGFELPLQPRYNIAPSQEVPVVRLAEDQPGTRQAAMLGWGLVPLWASEVSFGFQCINARSETAASKPAFRASFRRRRCLIPADGFFEWPKKGKARQPFLFRMRDGQPFAFAGLWDYWTKGDGRETCAILTTTANELVRPFHERMPVILPLAFHDDWLEPQSDAPQWLQTALRPYPAQEMEAVPVSSWVNNARHEGPECVRPVT
jgi:putative SOS response-associated peptidase YedK